MRLGLFGKSPFEGLVIARSDRAEEAARKRSTNMMERNNVERQDDSGSEALSGQAASQGDTPSPPAAQGGGIQGGGRPVPIIASAPADSVSEGLPAASAKSQPDPTQAVQPIQAVS
jgi:hypothetical protein